MTGSFDLHIDLGNEAMQDHRDVSGALLHLATKLEDVHCWYPDDDAEGPIKDRNGNTVGRWDLVLSEPAE